MVVSFLEWQPPSVCTTAVAVRLDSRVAAGLVVALMTKHYMLAAAALLCLQPTAGVSVGDHVAQHQPLGAGGTAGRGAVPPRAAPWQLPGSSKLLLLRGVLRVLCQVCTVTISQKVAVRHAVLLLCGVFYECYASCVHCTS
jgi:hypothetical protein